MTMLQSLRAVAFAVTLLFGSSTIQAGERIPASTVTSITTRDGQQGIALTLAFSDDWGGSAKWDESYLEFIVAKLPTDKATSFTAYLATGVLRGAVDLAALPIVSYWDITPMDHDNGLGGYVRLYLPEEILPSRAASSISLIVVSDYASPVDLLVGTSGGVLITPGRDREVAR